MESANPNIDADESNQTLHQRRGSMTEEEEKERRASIKAIMNDPHLTPQERRKSIQSLMDGRRRSSTTTTQRTSGCGSIGGMASAAAAAAADFELGGGFSDDDSSSGDDDEGLVDPDVRLMVRQSSRSSLLGGSRRNSSQNVTGGSSRRSSNLRGSLRSSLRGSFRASLRGSFTTGFAKMGIKSPVDGVGDAAEVKPPDPNALSRKMEQSRPSCGHYDRNCSIVSPCCGLVFGCRICHDDSPVLPPPFLLNGGQTSSAELAASGMSGASHTMEGAAAGSLQAAPGERKPLTHRSASMPPLLAEEESHHNIDRFLIKEIICRECFTRQSSKTNHCVNCGIVFGGYHCNTCNLWMSAEDDPYHCDKCGFCRVGGKENFTHCDGCGMCIDSLLFEDHNCKAGKYMSNCPVCQEDLFSSRLASHEMPCGHAIHWSCFRELTSFDTRCPVCKKTAETRDQMEQTWNTIATSIALQPVPADMTRVVDILCIDCEEMSEKQRWHPLGVQCMKCYSFNTTEERTVMVGYEAAEFLGPANTRIGSQADGVEGSEDRAMSNLADEGETGLNNEGVDSEGLSNAVSTEMLRLMSSPSEDDLDFELNAMGRPVSRSDPSSRPFSNMDANFGAGGI